jgi:arsenate reductase-like glutaredoxin family protein
MKVVLYSRDNCQNCSIVKTLFKQHEIPFDVVENPSIDEITPIANKFDVIIRSFPFAVVNNEEYFNFLVINDDVRSILDKKNAKEVNIDINL